MQPSDAILNAIATLLAHDTATLANATANHVHLAKAPFTPAPGFDVTTFVEADFIGYAILSPTAGNQLEFLDPVTLLRTIELAAPVGGWHFQTTGITNLPQTIYGWWVTNAADTALYAMGLLGTPVALQASGQGFDLPLLRFAFLNNSPQ